HAETPDPAVLHDAQHVLPVLAAPEPVAAVGHRVLVKGPRQHGLHHQPDQYRHEHRPDVRGGPDHRPRPQPDQPADQREEDSRAPQQRDVSAGPIHSSGDRQAGQELNSSQESVQGLRHDTIPADSKVAISPRIAAAASRSGNNNNAPVPSPSLMPHVSRNGSRPSRPSAAACPGSAERWAAIITAAHLGCSRWATSAAAVAMKPSRTTVSPASAAAMKKPASAAISRPATAAMAARTSSGRGEHGRSLSRIDRCASATAATTARFRARMLSSAPAPRPTAVSTGTPASKAVKQLAGVLLPIPISPAARTRIPSAA